jgi:hypothetical protein
VRRSGIRSASATNVQGVRRYGAYGLLNLRSQIAPRCTPVMSTDPTAISATPPQISESISDRLFESFWTRTVPLPFRLSGKLKEQARASWDLLIEEIFQAAGTPNAIAAAACTIRIGRLLSSARLIVNDPNPSPDAIAKAIESLLERLKRVEEKTATASATNTNTKQNLF